MWAIKTKTSQLINFDHDQLSRIIVQKQSPQTSSQSINLNKKSIIKRSLQDLIDNLQFYQPISDEINMSRLKDSRNLQTKRYRQCVYFGQMIQKRRQGEGIMFYTNGRIYEGKWANNLKCGKGYEKFPNNSVYKGDYFDGKPDGYGKYEWQNGEIYEGEWVGGLKNGSGIWRGSKGDSYIGEWKNGKANGYGVHTWINGNRYEGEFLQCLKHGQGIDKFANGDIYKGSYENGKPHGCGEYFWVNTSYYKGEFKDGLRNGKGIWKKSNQPNSDIYQGDFINQKKEGYGTFIWSNGSKYIGNFKNDLRQGYGEMYWSDGSVYKGQWRNGEQVQQISNQNQFNFDLYNPSQELMRSSLLNEEDQNKIQFPNPQQNQQFHLFQEPNHPEIYQLKKFRARGMINRNKNKKQNEKLKISGGIMVCNNLVTQAIHINNSPMYANQSPTKNSVSKLNKRSSKLSFRSGVGAFNANKVNSSSSNYNQSKCRIRHSQSTNQKKAMSASFYNCSNYNNSKKNLGIKQWDQVQHRQNTSNYNSQCKNSRSNIKIKPRVIKSSNGVRNIYNRNMNSFWQEVEQSRNIILGKQSDQEVKWFTRSKNKSQYF